jgi:asparagine synthase (glutamine-hydrolysing)
MDSGKQPLEKDNQLLICNGQIYNYLDLANDDSCLRSDVDVIFDIFQNHKGNIATAAKEIDGDFAFVFRDADNVIHIARDPIGIRPLFYGTDDTGNIICAASEAKALISLCSISNIHVFPPGHVWDSSTNKITKYTDIYDAPITLETDDSIRDMIKQKLYEAVEKRIVNTDRPIAYLCSGGLDSSIVLAIAHEILKDPTQIHIFSMQYESQGDDAFYASLLARSLGIQHTIVNFTQADIKNYIEHISKHIETYDPNTIRASVPMYLLAKYIKEHTDYKVFLSGEGADELFMGYNIFNNAPVDDGGLGVNEESQRLIRNIHMFDGLRADRCFNAHGLEIRFPFLDIDFVKYVFSIPGYLKTPQKQVEKALLRDCFRDIPSLQDSRVIDRVKERFSDGCGFDYVPQILRMFSMTHELDSREKAEKEMYSKWFDEAYGNQLRSLITERKNPSWCHKPTENIMAF